MAKIIGIAVGVALAIFAGPIGIGLFHSLVITNFLINAGLSIAAAGTLSLFHHAPGGVSSGSQASLREALAPWRVIYGQARVGGIVTYISTGGDNNEYLHMVITLACHKVWQISRLNVYINGKHVPLLPPTGDDLYYQPHNVTGFPGSQYFGFLLAEFHSGDPDDTDPPFPGLSIANPVKWDDTHLQRGRAKAHIVFKWQPDLFSGGIPENISFDIQGKEVFDPRLDDSDFGTPVDLDWQTLDRATGGGTGGTGNYSATAVKIFGATNFSSPLVASVRVTFASSNNVAASGLLEIQSAVLQVCEKGSTLVLETYQLMVDGAAIISIGSEADAQSDPIHLTLDPDHDYYILCVHRGAEAEGSIGNTQALALHGKVESTARLLNLDGMSGRPTVDDYLGATDVSTYNTFPASADVWAVISGFEVMRLSAYSSNPALCLLDYLLNAEFGMGADLDDIDLDSFIAAANICDESVALASGGTERRYTCNGVFDTSSNRGDIIKALVGSMAGTLVPPGDKWRVYAGAYREPTIKLGDSDFRNTIKLTSRRSRADLFNSVKGSFISPVNGWIPADYPAVQNAAAILEDQGEIWQDISYGFTISPSMCQRISKIALEKNRRQMSLAMPCKLKAFRAQPGDNAEITHARFGFTDKEFEIQSTTFIGDGGGQGQAPALGCDLVGQEIDEDVFAWSTEDETTATTQDPPDFPSQDGSSPDQTDFKINGA